MKKKIIIYGGSSYLSREIIKILSQDDYYFIIFCRNKKDVLSYLDELNIISVSYEIWEADLLDLNKNIQIIDKFNKDIVGLFWVAGKTGDPKKEFENTDICINSLNINYLNPVVIINKIITKFQSDLDQKKFIVVLTSVAGLRGRAERLFYSSAKAGLISYLSGLRQKLNHEKIKVITVIPGYMKTKPFNIKSFNFLISSPKKSAEIICAAMKTDKDIVYVSKIWCVIMFLINLIPEKIFKKMKF